MAKRVSRKFEAFAMHAHYDTPAAYQDIFQKLAALPRADRIIQISELVIAFPIVESDGTRFFIRAVEGGDSAPLVLNTDTGGTRENILGKSEVLSEASHLVVAPAKRRAVIEYVRRGPKAAVLSAAIEGILRARYKDLHNMRFEFTPVIAKNFAKEINSFDRIRVAMLRIVQPNAGWTDHYGSLSKLMEESGADKGDVTARAPEGKSLRKNDGLVGAIKQVVNAEQPYLDDASITGTRQGEQAETTIRANKHVVHTRSNVEADSTGVANPDDVRTKLFRFLGTLS